MFVARIGAALAATSALWVLACAPAGDGATQDPASETAAVDVSAFTEACMASSNLERAICECAGGLAASEMSQNAFAFLVASLNQDEARTEALRAELSIQEAMSAGTFMARGPAQCARP